MPEGIDLPAQTQRRALFRKCKPERVHFIKAQGIGISQLIVRHCAVLHPFSNINNYSIQDLQLILCKRGGAALEVPLLLRYDHLQPFNGLPGLFVDKTDITDWTGTSLFIIFDIHYDYFKSPAAAESTGLFSFEKDAALWSRAIVPHCSRGAFLVFCLVEIVEGLSFARYRAALCP